MHKASAGLPIQRTIDDGDVWRTLRQELLELERLPAPRWAEHREVLAKPLTKRLEALAQMAGEIGPQVRLVHSLLITQIFKADYTD